MLELKLKLIINKPRIEHIIINKEKTIEDIEKLVNLIFDKFFINF